MHILECIEEWKSHRFLIGDSENSIYTQGKYAVKFAEGLTASIQKSVSKIKVEHIMQFVNAFDNKSRNTKMQKLASLKGLLAFGLASGHILHNPASVVKVNSKRLKHKQREGRERIPFTRAEFDEIVDRAPYFYRQAAGISWFTGLRLGDICRLEWDSLIRNKAGMFQQIIVWTDKRDKRVMLPISDPFIGGGQLRMFLDEIKMLEGHPHKSGYCFPEQKADIENPKARSKISAYFTRIVRKAGIDGKSFHCLRHSFVSRLATEGRSLKEIGKLVGHSNTETTEGYAHHGVQ